MIAFAKSRGFWQTSASMKKLIPIFTLALVAAGVRAALPQPDLIAQIHFAGAQNISAAANFAAFTNEFSSAEAVALRAQTADKLSVWLAGWLQQNVGAAVPGGAAKLRPLFDDLQQAEWFLEARAAAGGRADAAIAIKLDPARAQLWQANLKPLFPAATFKSSGGWLIFDSGTGAQKAGDSLALKISAPQAGWFSADVNWPRLAQWYPKLKELGLPETQFAVAAPDASLRVTGKFIFPENLALNLENWRVPTNTIHQPFVSFTAVRGFAAWLKSQPWAQPCQLSPEPNQLFVWALPQIPYQTFAAAPVPDAAGALAQVEARLQPVLAAANARDQFISPVSVLLTNREITVRGVPVVAPYFREVNEPAGQFILAGAFPNTPRGRTPAPGWLQRFTEKNLVYYHWENTAERVPQLLNLSQLALVVSRHRQLDGHSAAFNWVQKSGAVPGESITEITQVAPDQLAFARKSPGLFTAAERFALANWLQAPNFPGCDLKMPPLSEKLKQLRLKHPGAMPAPAPAPAPAR